MIKDDYERKTKAFKQMQQAYINKQKVRFTKGKLFIDGKDVPIDKYIFITTTVEVSLYGLLF